MSDIHQEWRELRQKNGDFINHLDGEMAKIEKEKRLLDELQNPTDAESASVAFTMQFVAPPPFNCCQDDRDILKALNKAQADRIKTLEDELLARKEQQQIDLAVKKDLDEKLDKATSDYRALWVMNEDLKHQLAGAKAQCENTVENRRRISELSQEVIDLRERLAKTNESLKRCLKQKCDLQAHTLNLEAIRQSQAKEIERLRTIVDTPNGSCSAYTQQGMQSKIAKQAAEIKRLAKENEDLKGTAKTMHKMLDAGSEDIYKLRMALQAAIKDAGANFERGKIKGMEEIWDELRDCYDGRPTGENEKIFGYCTVGEIVGNLSPTWFMNKAREYHEQKEKEEARDIKLGDEVEIFDQFCPDDDPHSDIGIVVIVDSKRHSYVVVGPKFEGCFDETDIDAGIAKKTGRHFDTIPLDYLA